MKIVKVIYSAGIKPICGVILIVMYEDTNTCSNTSRQLTDLKLERCMEFTLMKFSDMRILMLY